MERIDRNPVRTNGARAPAVLGFLLTLAALGCGPGVSGTKTASGKAEEETRVRVRLGEFARGAIESKLAVAAALEPVREADYYPQVEGIVEEVLVREGDDVARNQPVIRLIDDDLALVVENKKILLDQAKTRLDQADLAYREGQSQLDQKRLLVEEAEADYQRNIRLGKGTTGIVSEEELEAKRYQRDRAEVDLDAAKLALEKFALQKTEAEQNLKLADVQLRTAELDLARTVLRSPVDGHVSYLDLKPGEKVTQSTLAFTVVDTTALRARLHPPQKELRRLRVGQPVRIRSDIYPEESFQGAISVINPVIDRQNGTVGVIVDVEDEKNLLKPGMFVTGEIILDVHPDATLVSQRAVLYENQEPVLYLVEDDIARRYVLTPGYSSKDHLEVVALTDMDGRRHASPPGRLVIVGQNKLEDRSRVDVEPEPPPTTTPATTPATTAEARAGGGAAET